MRAGLAFVIVAYMLSQFYRAFLAVLSPVLIADLGATTGELARASGLWFVCFAIMQLPVGWALDTHGPRRTAALIFGVGAAGGAAIFATAQGPLAIQIAMALIGIGCAPVLMATYYIFARSFSAAMFGTLAGVTVGVSSLGNILSTAPLALAIETFGWRETVAGFAVLSLVIAIAIGLFLRDPIKPEGEARGSFLDLLRMPILWPILIGMFVCYAPLAGIRGLWISPYITERFGADLAQVGSVTLVMSLAMVAGNFLYGPIDRLFGSRKWPILAGNLVVALLCLSFWVIPPAGIWQAAALFAAIGIAGASYPGVMAHGRAFLPAHLTGRGVSLLNFFGMGGVGVMQFASGPYFSSLSARVPPDQAYGQLFGVFGITVVVGLVIYMFSRDNTG